MTTAHGRGFTLLELSICVSILAIIVPGIYVWARTLESDHAAALADLESARAYRTIREEVARDRWTRSWGEGATLQLVGDGACGKVTYELNAGVVMRRDACAPPRALAKNVRALERSGEVIHVTFEHRLNAGRLHVVTLPRGEKGR